MKDSSTCSDCFHLQGITQSCFSSMGTFAYCVKLVTVFVIDYGLTVN